MTQRIPALWRPMDERWVALGAHSASINIDAPPDVVYDLLADVTRIPEWSPECRRVEWSGERTIAEVGARFRGHNRWRWVPWTREARVTQADRPRAFAFETLRGSLLSNNTTRWRYELEPTTNGTRLTESYEYIGVPWNGAVDRFTGRPKSLERNIDRTLQALKVASESHRWPADRE